jgi:hypothetical protein
MKPRIRPKRRIDFKSPWFECSGPHPIGFETAYGYGRTLEEAYLSWYGEPIPF